MSDDNDFDSSDVDPIKETLDQTRYPDPDILPADSSELPTDANDLLSPVANASTGLTQIGRYRVVRLLGSGGFANVYLAKDETLGRDVSIKVPHAHRALAPKHLNRYLDEAKIVAALEHPKIVPIYDIGNLPSGLWYVVSKYIDGQTLADVVRKRQLSVVESVRIVIDIAETLQHVHQTGIVHRDIKPSNILQDRNGTLFVNDFGLALIELDESDRGIVIGTPGYMSPEQASGEGHLVDGRSDVFSMGVILYELLARRRPFVGKSTEQILYKVRRVDPKPIRQFNSSVPRELDLVCQKAMAKRASQRHASAIDLANDLRLCLGLCQDTSVPLAAENSPNTSGSSSSRLTDDGGRVVVIPKGLRSYDSHDASFFLHMLPGPYDVHGIPDSIRFWKNRIDPSPTDSANISWEPDSNDAQNSRFSIRDQRQQTTEPFRVGVIYGTSGCGKSSFVRAGLIPSLDPRVQVCMLDATTSCTVENLSALLVKKFLYLKQGTEISLDEQMANIRRRGEASDGGKPLIVIDQFEQWLSSATMDERQVMVSALRQCDGEHLQAILLIRDDYWLAITRLMQELDIPLAPSHNLAMVDLLDKHHAAKLLRMFGRAFGRIGQEDEVLRKEQHAFIQEAVELLAEDQHVVAVRLTLLAEIFKSRDWTRASLRKMGGMDRIVERFLIESFDLPSSPKNHRINAQAARQLLGMMLPESGLIRTSAISRAELIDALDGHRDAKANNELFQILDGQLKLITMVESSSLQASQSPMYQLTHDSLVPAIRQWIIGHQGATMRGRAARDLRQRAANWRREPGNRELPTLFDLIRFTILAPSWYRETTERNMMCAASWFYGWRVSLAAIAVLLIALGVHEYLGHVRSDATLDRLGIATTTQLPATIESLIQQSRFSYPKLRRQIDDASLPTRDRFLAALSIPDNVDTTDNQATDTNAVSSVQMAHTYLATAPLDLVALSLRIKPSWSDRLQNQLLVDLEDKTLDASVRLRAAFRLGSTAAQNADAIIRQQQLLVDEILDEAISNRLHYVTLIELAKPLAPLLRQGLIDEANAARTPARHDVSIALWRDLHSDDLAQIIGFGIELGHDDFVNTVAMHVDRAESFYEIGNELLRNDRDVPQPTPVSARRYGQLGALLLAFASNEQEYSQACKNVESWMPSLSDTLFAGVLIHTVTKFVRSVDYPDRVFEPARWAMESRIDRDEMETESGRSLMQQTALLTAGQFVRSTTEHGPLEQVRSIARESFLGNPDAATHAAAWWTLCQFADDQWIDEQRTMAAKPATHWSKEKGWRVNQEGHTMMTVDASAAPEVGVVLEVACGQTTVEQYLRFDPQYSHLEELKSTDKRSCVGVITWPEAVKYCQWLTRRDGLSESDLAYVSDDAGSMQLAEDYRDRAGYRLPLVSEWRYLWKADPARIQCVDNNDLILQYMNIMPGSQGRPERIGGCKPDRNGLFHLGSNAYEWMSNRMEHLALAPGLSHTDSITDWKDVTADRYLPREINWRSASFRVVRTIPFSKSGD